MQLSIDLNADIGEADTLAGQNAELGILSYVSSVNIACGGHAGNDERMRVTARAARMQGVVIGAHPAYPDPQNFGRKSMDISNSKVTRLLRLSLTEQIVRLSEICAEEGAAIAYVKPHGALYNDAVEQRGHADLIAETIKFIDQELIFMGAPHSAMQAAAKDFGLRFVKEGFIDRRYTDKGYLQDRRFDGAVIKDQDERMAQLQSLLGRGSVITASGQSLSLQVDSLCLHGDSAGAIDTARRARALIKEMGFRVKAFAL